MDISTTVAIIKISFRFFETRLNAEKSRLTKSLLNIFCFVHLLRLCEKNRQGRYYSLARILGYVIPLLYSIYFTLCKYNLRTSNTDSCSYMELSNFTSFIFIFKSLNFHVMRFRHIYLCQFYSFLYCSFNNGIKKIVDKIRMFAQIYVTVQESLLFIISVFQ